MKIKFNVGLVLVLSEFTASLSLNHAAIAAMTVKDPVKQIAKGRDYHCALFESGRVKCWGFNWGMLGLGDTNNRGDQPNEMGANLPYVDLGGEKVKQIVAGITHTCALFESGRVKCWGFNAFGQLGLGDRIDRGYKPNQMGENLPYVDLGPEKVSKISAMAANATCALFESGRVKCWGDNRFGQLGLGDTESRGDQPNEMGVNLPYVDLGPERVTSLDSGAAHTCALFESNRVKCWGWNGSGPLGLGDTNDRGDQPGEMGNGLPYLDLGAEKIIQLILGFNYSCANFESGRVKCWGNNQFGQLGLGDSMNRGAYPGEMGNQLPFVDLGQDVRVLFLATSYDNSTCALTQMGEVKCWGWNDYGQLGLGDGDNRGGSAGDIGDFLPYIDWSGDSSVKVKALFGSCILTMDDRVKCWGLNTFGQLGLGDRNHRGDEPNEMGKNLPYVDLGNE